MSRCFISYRHVSPDQDLARAIGAALSRSGHRVFLDTKITVGTRWGEEIEREIRAAESFVVLLSEQSVRSDMVRQEVELAHQLSEERELRILPVRVSYIAALPYDLAAYLNRLQYSLWNEGEPYDRLCAEVESAVNRRSGLTEQAAAAAASVAPFAPNSTAVRFEADALDGLAKELAVYVGPVARVLVSRAAKKTQTWKQLYDALAEEVPAGSERQRFLTKRPLS